MTRLLTFLFVVLCSAMLGAQSDQGIGSWKSYLPYNYGYSVTQSEDAVFYGTEWAILKVNKVDLSIEYFSKVEGLSEIGVKSVTYGSNDGVLIVTYTNSNIDLVFEDEIVNLNQIKNNTQIVGDRNIYSVHIESPYAYLACGFGVVQLDIENAEFGFTAFTNTAVLDVTYDDQKLIIATEMGLYTAPDNGSVNLADFSQWQPLGFSEGLPTSYRSNYLTTIDGNVHVGIDNALYRENDGRFKIIHNEPGYEVSFATGDESGTLTGWRCLTNCNAKKILIEPDGGKKSLNNCTTKATDAIIDESGRVWYADENKGYKMSEGFTGSCHIISPDRPPTHNSSQVATFDRNLYVATGGVTINYGYLFRADGMFTNESGSWESLNRRTSEVIGQRDMRDFLCIEISDEGVVYIGTFWDGLIEYNGEEVKIYDKDNSSLQNSVINPEFNRVTDLTFDDDGNLWMLNHDAPRPVSVFTKEGEWHSFSLPTPTNAEHIAIDANGYKWIAVGGVGVVVFDSGTDFTSLSDDRYEIFNTTNSALTVNAINSIEADHDGTIWVGTTSGPVLFSCGNSVFEEDCSKRLTVVENGIPGELLGEENIRAIAVDPANRKWFGTSNGIFVQSPDGRTQVEKFTVRNSPLFDNGIVDISVDPIDGEVFIATNKGILSYRGDATEGRRFHESKITVFPNPVRPEYDGPIAIKGLAENANVKITDVNGNLVYETTALGGQAIWYGEDFTGRRASSGVYLVFSTGIENTVNPDAAVTKIMLVN